MVLQTQPTITKTGSASKLTSYKQQPTSNALHSQAHLPPKTQTHISTSPPARRTSVVQPGPGQIIEIDKVNQYGQVVERDFIVGGGSTSLPGSGALPQYGQAPMIEIDKVNQYGQVVERDFVPVPPAPVHIAAAPVPTVATTYPTALAFQEQQVKIQEMEKNGLVQFLKMQELEQDMDNMKKMINELSTSWDDRFIRQQTRSRELEDASQFTARSLVKEPSGEIQELNTLIGTVQAKTDELEVHTRQAFDKLAEIEAGLMDKVRMVDDKHRSHVENAASLEQGLANALNTSHQKLSEELAILQSSHQSGHGSLQQETDTIRSVLEEVTKQVAGLDVDLQQEQQLRLAVEQRIDKMFDEVKGEIEAGLANKLSAMDDKHNIHIENAASLERGLSNALQTSHSKLQEELAILKSSHQSGHGNLQQETDMIRSVLEEVTKQVAGLDVDVQEEQRLRLAVEQRVDKVLTEMKLEIEAGLANKLSAMDDKHNIHIENAASLEKGLTNALNTSHSKLQEDLAILRSSHQAGHGNLQQQTETLQSVLEDVTKQVDGLDAGLRTEQQLRLAVEQRVDKVLTEMKSEIEAGLMDKLSMVDDKHRIHIENAASLERGLTNALNTSHSKLQEDLAILRSSHQAGHGNLQQQTETLQSVLEDVTKQVDALDGDLQKEQQLRLAVEQRVDNKLTEIKLEIEGSFNDKLSVVDDKHKIHVENAASLERGLTNALNTSHSKLQEDLAILRSSHQSGHGNLQQQTDTLQSVLEDVTKQVDALDGDLQKEQQLRLAVEERVDKTFNEIKLEIRTGLRANLTVMDEKHRTHVDNASSLERGLSSALHTSHSKLQEELAILKSTHQSGHGNLQQETDTLRSVLEEVTNQVAGLDVDLQQEQQLRLAVQQRVDELFDELKAEIAEMNQSPWERMQKEAAQRARAEKPDDIQAGSSLGIIETIMS